MLTKLNCELRVNVDLSDTRMKPISNNIIEDDNQFESCLSNLQVKKQLLSAKCITWF